MSWLVEKIEIQNFKFFRDKFIFYPERKNVLVYGENGSGKSSLYWALYTFLQSSDQNKEEATSYFSSNSEHNLRNRFAPKDMSSYIKIDFCDDNDQNNVLEISETSYFTDGEEKNEFIGFTRICSDFLNYRFLYSIFDFSNKQENDIFEIFEKDFMEFLSFNNSLASPDNRSSNNSLQCRIFLKESFSKLRQKNLRIATKDFEKFKNYFNLFNREFKLTLKRLEFQINTILSEKFNITEKLKFNFTPAEFKIKSSNSTQESFFKNPKFPLKLRYLIPI